MTPFDQLSDEAVLRAAGLVPAPAVQPTPFDHLSDQAIADAAGPLPQPPATPAPQMGGFWREPALAASNFAKGAIGAASNLMDTSGALNMTQGQAALNVIDNLTGNKDDIKPLPDKQLGIAAGDMAAARKAGIIDRPDLEPQGFGERMIAGGSQGVGGSVVFPGDIPAMGMNAVRGFTGGMGAEIAHEITPDSQVAPLIGGLLGSGAPDAARAGISAVTNVGRNAFGIYDPAIRATQIITKKLAADGIDPADIASTIAVNPDKPLTIADLAGPSTQRIARASLDVPSEGSAEATQMLQDRDLGRGVNGPYDMFRQGGTADRIVSNIKSALGSDDAFKTATDLMAQQQQQAAPLYDAFRAELPTPARQIQPFMSSPTFRAALGRANASILDEGGNPLTDMIDFNEAGDPIRVKGAAFPPDTLDRIKQGIDDHWLAAKASGDRGAARTANILRSRFVQFLDTKYPDTYPAARLAYAGPSASLDALQQGADVFKSAPQDVASTLQSLAPENQNMFRIGVQQALISKVQNTADGANEVRQLFGNPAKRMSVAAAFDNPDALGQLSQDLGLENRMFKTSRDLLGNSNTAPRALDQAELSQPGFGEMGQAAAHAAGGNWKGALMTAARPMLNRIIQGANPETTSILAQSLLNPDQQKNAATLAMVQALMRQQPPQPMLPSPIPGLISGGLTAQPIGR